MSVVSGESCKTCYGEGTVPTDDGALACPDCGGAGVLPHGDTLVEWRLREIERVHGERDEEVAKDIKWLAFELRRAREALTEVVAMTDDVDVPAVPARMRFIINRALGLYGLAAPPRDASGNGRGGN